VFSFPWWLSFAVGFLSLSEEIIWYRVVGFRYETLPPAFSFVLVCYLAGIAAGAAFGKRLCGNTQDLYRAAAILLIGSAVADLLTPLFIANVISPNDFDVVAPAIAIALTAALKSTLFPIVHHLGSFSQGPRVGRSVSRIYFGNILGATLGPLVTGFIALDYLSVDQCFVVIAAICLLASAACAAKSRNSSLMLGALSAAVLLSPIAYQAVLSGSGSLVEFASGVGNQAVVKWVANRHGVIHIARTTRGDAVFGGNVYDGIAAVNVDRNANNLERLYMLALLNQSPKHALFIGLSAGAWVRAMQGFTTLESIDVVEINPGYIEVIKSYPQLTPLLSDPRVHIHIDDGRRWLRRNPGARFDFFVQNATYYWRANSGNLLSKEYFLETRRHLSPGGILIANTTGSFDVLATVQAVFGHAYRFRNFVYASDSVLSPDIAGLTKIYRPDGTRFAFDEAPPTSVSFMLKDAKLEPVEAFLARRRASSEIITDDNLVSEYRDGRRFGPAFLRALSPPEPRQFGIGDP
jgi:spermidine synthase